MKLVFQRYMEFESKLDKPGNVDALRERVEQYLKNVYGGDDDEDEKEN